MNLVRGKGVHDWEKGTHYTVWKIGKSEMRQLNIYVLYFRPLILYHFPRDIVRILLSFMKHFILSPLSLYLHLSGSISYLSLSLHFISYKSLSLSLSLSPVYTDQQSTALQGYRGLTSPISTNTYSVEQFHKLWGSVSTASKSPRFPPSGLGIPCVRVCISPSSENGALDYISFPLKPFKFVRHHYHVPSTR